MTKTAYIYAILSVGVASCHSNNDIDIHLNNRSNIIDVSDDIVEFVPDSNVIIGSNPEITSAIQYLFIKDGKSTDNLIYVFDARTLDYKGSFAKFGHGPEEILVPGQLQINDKERTAYLFDHGQLKIQAFNVDSALQSPEYKPWVKQRFDSGRFPDRYRWINDTLGFGRLILPDYEHHYYKQSLCKYNITTGEITEFGNIERIPESHSMFDVSAEKNIVAEAYCTNDLVIFYDLDGNVLHRVFGPEYDEKPTQRITYTPKVRIIGDKLFCQHSGTKDFYGNLIHIYSLDGRYLQTLDAGRTVETIALLQGTTRLFMAFNDDMQFGTLDLAKLGLMEPRENTDDEVFTKHTGNGETAKARRDAGKKPTWEFIETATKRIDTCTVEVAPGTVYEWLPFSLRYWGTDSIHYDRCESFCKEVSVTPRLDFALPEIVLGVITKVDMSGYDDYDTIEGDVKLHYKDFPEPAVIHIIVRNPDKK